MQILATATSKLPQKFSYSLSTKSRHHHKHSTREPKIICSLRTVIRRRIDLIIFGTQYTPYYQFSMQILIIRRTHMASKPIIAAKTAYDRENSEETTAKSLRMSIDTEFQKNRTAHCDQLKTPNSRKKPKTRIERTRGKRDEIQLANTLCARRRAWKKT